MAIDRLPSGSFRARLMIDGKRYTATWPTEADARLWEIETRAAVAERRGADVRRLRRGLVGGFIDDAPDRARFKEALEHRLLPVLGELPLLEVLAADREELARRLLDAGGDGDDGTTRKCLHLILEDAVEDLRAGIFDVGAPTEVAPRG